MKTKTLLALTLMTLPLALPKSSAAAISSSRSFESLQCGEYGLSFTAILDPTHRNEPYFHVHRARIVDRYEVAEMICTEKTPGTFSCIGEWMGEQDSVARAKIVRTEEGGWEAKFDTFQDGRISTTCESKPCRLHSPSPTLWQYSSCE